MSCPQCFRGDYWEPPWQCGECEARQIEREEAYEHEQRQEELTDAFHDMCDALDADRAKLIALGADPGPTMSEVFGHASDMAEDNFLAKDVGAQE